MRRLTPFPWVSVLTLAIALAPGAASAQEDDTVTISGPFRMDYLGGTVGPDLAEVYTNGDEHTWTLTLHGTYQSHSTWVDLDNAIYSNSTKIQAASFDLKFFGPDAATLNGFVSEYLAGGEVVVNLQNTYFYDGWDGFTTMYIQVEGADAAFSTGYDYNSGSSTLFPSDADGFPVVGPEPFSIWVDYSELWDNRPGNYGYVGSFENLVTFEGQVGQSPPPPPPLPMLAIQDGSVLEGNRGTTWLNLTVSLSRYPADVVTVDYETVDGSARSKSDYTATSGTLLFFPDEMSHTISIAIKADRKREPHEIFYVELFNVDGATITDGVATATIMNDD